MKTKSNGSGGRGNVVPLEHANGERRLLAAEADEVRALERIVADKERELGRLSIAILSAQDQQRAAAQQHAQDVQRRDKRIEEIARAHGIDLASPKAGKWNIDTTVHEMAFRRVAP